MILFQNTFVTVFQSALFQTNTCVVHTDDLLLVVDPNWLPGEVQTIRQFVEKQMSKKWRPLYLLFTHSDYDHIIGYRAFPGARVIASEAFVQNPDKEAVIEQIRTWDDENYVRRDYPIEYPEADIVVTHDGQTLQTGQTTLTFFLAPGHNPDGIITMVSPYGVLLAGDYLAEVEFPYLYFSSFEYEKTLDKIPPLLKDHQFKILAPGHGSLAFSNFEIIVRWNDSHKYIETLRRAVEEGTEFDTSALWERYHFPRGMQKFHDGNVALLRKELGK